MSFYAVIRGRIPGIYLTWDACNSQMNGFSCAQWNSFSTAAAAQDFLYGPQRCSSGRYPFGYYGGPHQQPTTNVAFTDGCCLNNGYGGAKAGVGVHWGDRNPLNVRQKLNGRQTNQRAEVVACIIAVEQARNERFPDLTIVTDSEYAIKGATHQYTNIQVNWEEFQYLEEVSQGINVKYHYVPGHKGIPGNVEADKLANEGANM